MNTIETTILPNRIDRAVTQLAGQSNEPGTRQRSARAYDSATRTHAGIERAATLANAPAALELGENGHIIQAFANYDQAEPDGTVQVRMVDSATTLTVRELTVGDYAHNRTQIDDYGILRFGMKPRIDQVQ